MYFITYSTNKLELSLPGWNVWSVKHNKQTSYKILDILIGGMKRPEAKNVFVNNSYYIVDNEKSVIKRFFE
jgi:hypothetical protein